MCDLMTWFSIKSLNNIQKCEVMKILFSTLILITLVSCGQKEEVVARVGKTDITQSEFNAYLENRRIAQSDKDSVAEALDDYLQKESIAQAISDTELLDVATINEEVADFRRQLMFNRYFEKYLGSQVSEQAIINYYNSHKEDYATTKAHIAHILVESRSGLSDEEKAQAESRIRNAHAKIIGGMDFSEAAETFSDDKRSAKNGGDIGWVGPQLMRGELLKKTLTMKEGDISDPFETQLGYHIIKLLEAPVHMQKPYEKVKGDIRYQLRQKAKTAEIKRLQESVKWEKVGQ